MEMEERSLNFIEQIVEKDLQEGKNDGRIQTRFPPAKRLPAYRSRQGHLHGLWYRREIQWRL